MIRSWRGLTASGMYLLLAAATAASCRTGGVCESSACSSDAASVGGGAGQRPGAPPSGEHSVPAQPGGEGGAAGGEGGAAGGAGQDGAAATHAGEAAQSDALECEANFADCDESRLTGCETELTWSVRHCGACNVDCDGACVAGSCKPSTLVADRLLAQTMVASATTGFARATDAQGNYSIVRIDMESGKGQVMQAQVAGDVVLALGADRVYFFDPGTTELRSTAFDGASLTLEQELVGANDFGASPQGAYYIESETDPDTWEETETLWFRATGTGEWKTLRGPGNIELYRSSSFGVVASEQDANSASRLLWLRGNQITDLGPEPDSLIEAVATRNAVVVLTEGFLHWLTPDSLSDNAVTRSYEIELSSTSYDLTVLGEEVAILYQDDGKAAVRFHAGDGSTSQRFGVAPWSTLVFADSKYLWYGVEDNWLERRFLRAQWFDFLP